MAIDGAVDEADRVELGKLQVGLAAAGMFAAASANQPPAGRLFVNPQANSRRLNSMPLAITVIRMRNICARIESLSRSI